MRAATHLITKLRSRGFDPIGVDLSQLLKAGGGVKCCTLELRDPMNEAGYGDVSPGDLEALL
jgi:hypothetical protein